ncbi:hypothetical protein WJX84_010056, partial [Apatococcus fuscideae]
VVMNLMKARDKLQQQRQQDRQPTAAAAQAVPAAATPQASRPASQQTQPSPPLPATNNQEQKPKRKPHQADPETIRRWAEQAIQRQQPIFTAPLNGAIAGQPARLFYNRAAGPLPQGGALVMKAGYNEWEDIQLHNLQQADELKDLNNSDWLVVETKLPEDTWKLDFVVMDENSGRYDNNKGQDFALPLAEAPSQEDVLQERAAAFQRAEQQRLQALEQEEEKIHQQTMAAAREAAETAKRRYRQNRQTEWTREAESVVEERRSPDVANLPTSSRQDHLFAWSQGGPQAGHRTLLAYNRAAGPLRNSSDVSVVLGYDGWWQQDIRTEQFSRLNQQQLQEAGLQGEGHDWWGKAVEVPRTAAIIDFVFCDNARRAWDNNRQRDFHSDVVGALNPDQLVQHLCDMLQRESSSELARGEQAAADRTIRNAHQKALALKKRRAARRQILYTTPVAPRAGESMEVFYNPDATVLRGRPETWLRGSFNRWQHPQPIQPRVMTAALPGGVGFHRAAVQVPRDAHTVDIVLADSGDDDAGFFDNNDGLDYHIPVTGSSHPAQPLHIVHIAVEMAPVAKVGGMGDVVTALGRAVQDEGHRVEVILPKYDCMDYDQVRGLKQLRDFWCGGVQVKVWEAEIEDLRTILLEPSNGAFWVGCIYGRNDDAHRFAFFCNAALEYLKHHAPGSRPDILHCHDWSTAPIAYADTHPSRSVFTLHNLNFGADLIGRAMGGAAAATTVSPTYAVEVSGHPAIAPHLSKFYGVRNGIDQDIWDPTSDSFLPRLYDSKSETEGKAAAKAELRKHMSLSSADVPLVGVVTRLTHQKGIHLIKHAAWRTLERGGQFVLLGSAPDPRVQGEFNALAGDLGRQYPDRARLWFAYDEPLSHLIYAGCDMLLVPSIFEPCGLTQMVAMRYGTVPVVRRTGGLADTVFDVEHDDDRASATGMVTNGFSFDGSDAAGMDYALNRALSMWYNEPKAWRQLCQRVMEQDWSWADPALDYIELYHKALR